MRRHLNDKHRAGSWDPHSSDALQLSSAQQCLLRISPTPEAEPVLEVWLQVQMMLRLCSHT